MLPGHTALPQRFRVGQVHVDATPACLPTSAVSVWGCESCMRIHYTIRTLSFGGDIMVPPGGITGFAIAALGCMGAPLFVKLMTVVFFGVPVASESG